MTSVDETLPISDQDKEKEPINDEVETNEEIQMENKGKEPNPIGFGQVKDEQPIIREQDPMVSQTPTEFCEEIKEKTRVQKLFECPKCKKMLTKKTLNYYHECTKNDLPKAKRRPKKQIVLEEIAEEPKQPNGQTVTLKKQTVEQGIQDIEDLNLPVQKTYEELRKERLQQRIQQRTVKIQQLFQSAI